MFSEILRKHSSTSEASHNQGGERRLRRAGCSHYETLTPNGSRCGTAFHTLSVHVYKNEFSGNYCSPQPFSCRLITHLSLFVVNIIPRIHSKFFIWQGGTVSLRDLQNSKSRSQQASSTQPLHWLDCVSAEKRLY